MLYPTFFLLTRMMLITNYSKHKRNVINDLVLRESRHHYSDMDNHGLVDDHDQQDQEEEDGGNNGGNNDDPYTTGNK